MLVYLHGFNSSPASHKAQLLKAYLEGRGLGHLYACPALPPLAADALREIEPLHLTKSDCLVGSSLGGFYATYLAEKLDCCAVLINPAITPHIGLEAYLGTQTNLHTGAPYELTRAHLEGWRALLLQRVDPERYLLLLETGDEVLDWREAARKYEGARMVIRQGGDHTLQSFAEHIGRILDFAGVRA
ncbi:MAG: esterase [Betaproteobacteria bacterium]|nr:esterase [Betaproteobacteria bacterium]